VKPTALTTIKRCEGELGRECADTDARDYLGSIINSVSSQIERILNRALAFEAGRVEDLPGFGLPRLRVAKPPIVTLTSVSIIGTKSPILVDPIDLATLSVEDDGRTGIIYNPAGWPDTGGRSAGIAGDRLAGTEEHAIRVTFDGGFVTPEQAKADTTDTLVRSLPDEIEDAAAIAVASRFSRRGDDHGIKSERILSGSVSFDLDSKTGLPKICLSMIRPYRIFAQGAGQ